MSPNCASSSAVSVCEENISSSGICGSFLKLLNSHNEYVFSECIFPSVISLQCVCVVLNGLFVCVFCVSQEKQNEALYLREHRGELVEELAKTIVQKVKQD